MKRLFQTYINTFKGLSVEVWWLALVTLINRAGTMVIPFLSLYLTDDLNIEFSDVGWIMSVFGLGSVAGSYLGGKLTDIFGYYRVMIISLFLTGLMFIGLQYLKEFWSFCIGIFLVMTVADSFRPAMFVAMSTYSKPENKTRSVTLIRLAINLGVSAGPALGGLIITTMSYGGLFWIDGITCILATIVMIKVLNPKKAKVLDEHKVESPVSPLRDKGFMIMCFAMVLFGVIFLQYFSTMPVYYRDFHLLTELEIGLLLALNGLTIFVFEMPLISWLENMRVSKATHMIYGTIFIGMSFVVINLTGWIGILVIGMLFMTLGEMIIFPFSNAFAMDRARNGLQGKYMAFYTISFSIAHIGGHNAGFQLIDAIGFENTWNVMVFISLLCIFLLIYLMRILKSEKERVELKSGHHIIE